MPEHSLFYVALLSQVFLISVFFPRRILGRMKYVFATYPPSEYPKLYPKPVEHYESRHRNYRIMNGAILLAGIALIAMLIGISRTGRWDHVIATWYFLIQLSPVMLLDLSALKELKLMRDARSRSTRKAELHPRRLRDFVSPTLLSMAIVTYVAFVALILYVRQFEFPWFGGYWNIVGVTAVNLTFAGVALWHMYGKKLNPHQAYEDRMRQIESLVRIAAFTSIAATIFIAISVVLAAADARHLQSVVQCLYFQLLAVIGLQGYLVKITNFEVYKEDPLVT